MLRRSGRSAGGQEFRVGSATRSTAFVLARLEREGLEPSPPAVANTLFRRLSLDLIGLPPTLEELAAFDADERRRRPTSEQVERLLASPHFGERWGRIWLDAARYADSDGFEKDKPRFVWMYRDWVIDAFNRDLPYDEFVIEQIAGDLLPHPTQDQLVATGFLRNSMINEEGGIDPEQFRMEAMFDRMDAIGKGDAGLTIQCAQCHSHKYDPLTQTEYYRMFAFLNNCHEAQISVYTPTQQAEWQATESVIRTIEDRLRAGEPRLAAADGGLGSERSRQSAGMDRRPADRRFVGWPKTLCAERRFDSRGRLRPHEAHDGIHR